LNLEPPLVITGRALGVFYSAFREKERTFWGLVVARWGYVSLC